MPTEVRRQLARAFRTQDAQAMRSFGRFLLNNSDNPIACWGAIADNFDTFFPEDHARLRVLQLLITQGNPRALLLFIHLNLERRIILDKLCEQIQEMPITVQEALAGLKETQPSWREDDTKLSTPLRYLRKRPTWRTSVQERFQSRIQKLTRIKFWTPDPPKDTA